MPVIYKITNCISRKIYVGQAKDATKRWKAHVSCARRGLKTKLYCAMRGYGIENFKMEILEECQISEMNSKESFWIAKLDSLNSGYNMIADCVHGRIVSDETRKRMSDAQKGKKFSDEHRSAISAGGRGKKRSAESVEKSRLKLFGMKRTAEQIERLRIAAKKRNHAHLLQWARQCIGKPVSEKTRKAVSDAHRGKPKSQEQRAKMSAAAKNASPEVRAKRATAIRDAYARKKLLSQVSA
jgi:group I intron endonuclease